MIALHCVTLPIQSVDYKSNKSRVIKQERIENKKLRVLFLRPPLEIVTPHAIHCRAVRNRTFNFWRDNETETRMTDEDFEKLCDEAEEDVCQRVESGELQRSSAPIQNCISRDLRQYIDKLSNQEFFSSEVAAAAERVRRTAGI